MTQIKLKNDGSCLVCVLTWWRMVVSDMRVPFTKVLAFSMGVMLIVPDILEITLKETTN